MTKKTLLLTVHGVRRNRWSLSSRILFQSQPTRNWSWWLRMILPGGETGVDNFYYGNRLRVVYYYRPDKELYVIIKHLFLTDH